MSEEMRVNEIFARIQRGSQSFNVVLGVGIRGILLLLQHLMRMKNEKLLSGGEVESFEKYLKATGGRFEIINVPVPEGREEAFSDLKTMLEERKVRFHILPDLNRADNRIQICVYQPDAGRFAGCFKEYIQGQLTGGEMEEQNLMSLTDGRASLVSVPGEESMDLFRKDFDNLRINYAVMPDLKVGDGQVQILVANNDIPKMRHWYQLYQEDMVKAGKRIGEFKSMTMEQYQATAQMKPEEYIGTAPAELKEKLQKYEGQEKGAFAQAVDELEEQIGTADSYAFEKYLKNPDYEMLSVDHNTLVAPVDLSVFDGEAQKKFICRLPGTYGENERYLAVPKEQVFRISRGGREKYLSFVKTEDPPVVYDRGGKRAAEFDTGKSVTEHFDRVKEKLSQKELQKTAEIAARLSQSVPVPNPVLSR